MTVLIKLAVFVGVYLAVSVVIGLVTLILGLQHPGLPDWLRGLVDMGTSGISLVVAGIAAYQTRKRPRVVPPPPPPPFRG